MKRIALVLAVLMLAGCAARRPAPVVERAPLPAPPPAAETPAPPPAEKPVATHTVKRGETLVGIALQYGLDYRELAAWNNITNPNLISPGQVLVLAGPAGTAPAIAAPATTPLAAAGPPIEARPLANTPSMKVEPRAQKLPYSDKALAALNAAEAGAPPATVAEAPPVAPPPSAQERPPAPETEALDWVWPVKGKVLAPFTETSKGMDIAGRKGAAVLAAADGRVVYAGAGLRGYGKLVIIKHNNTWLSAYAHNDNILVKEQQDVRKGQKIAEMGSTDADQVKLHFEVRRQGKPVDPVKVLPTM
jgi:lipoprotein NlpD